MKDLRKIVDEYLERTGTIPTNFGIAVLRDPSFVRDLRAGRDCRGSTYVKVCAYIEAQDEVAE